MTRRSWDDLTKGEQRAALATFGQLAGAAAQHPAMRDDGRRSGEHPPARAKPVQHERAAARALVARARREWWGTYLVHNEAATSSRAEGRNNQQAGQVQGWPDYVLCVPGHSGYGDWEILTERLRVLAALELKAEQRRPKRDPGEEWWLEWGAEMEKADWGLASTPTRHGVTAYQAIWLWRLSGCGFRTRVAYGSEDAFAWLSEVCGDGPPGE